MNELEIVPSLDDIARDPRCVAALPRPMVTALLVRTAVVQSALAARLADSGASESQPDRVLNIEELVAMTGMSRRVLFAKSKSLSFITRVSRRSIVGSEAGLRRWLANRRRSA